MGSINFSRSSYHTVTRMAMLVVLYTPLEVDFFREIAKQNWGAFDIVPEDGPKPIVHQSHSATVTIQSDAGINRSCARTVPAIRLPVSQTMDRRKYGSL